MRSIFATFAQRYSRLARIGNHGIARFLEIARIEQSHPRGRDGDHQYNSE